jgi:hypothetical protein
MPLSTLPIKIMRDFFADAIGCDLFDCAKRYVRRVDFHEENVANENSGIFSRNLIALLDQ